MLVLWTLLLCRIAASELSSTNAEAHQREILKDVKTIRATGEGCLLTIFGVNGFPLAAGITESNNFHAMGAAGSSPLHKGRMAGFTLPDFLIPDDPTIASGDRSQKNIFLENLFRWLAGNKSPRKVLVVGSNDSLFDFLAKQAMNPVAVKLSDLPNLLAGVDVIVVNEYIPFDLVPILVKYLENGGSLAAAIDTCALLRTLRIPGDFAMNFPANMLSKKFGFVWRDDQGESKARAPIPGGIFYMKSSDLESTKFLPLWKKAKTAFLKRSIDVEDLGYARSLQSYFRTMPRDTVAHLPYIYPEAVNFIQVVRQPVPTERSPIYSKSDKLKLLLFDYLTAYVLAPEQVVAHPSSTHFPGKIAETTREGQTFERSINLDMEQGSWYSTGLYAPPGQIVTVKIEEFSSNEIPLIYLLIGCHSDENTEQYKWLRPSMVQRQAHFQDKTAVFNSPYGGTIFVVSREPPEDDPCVLIKLIFEGAVPAPYFKLGVTTIKTWREVNRLAPAPWAELATDKVILSVKSEDIRDLDDPVELMKLWDELLDRIADERASTRGRSYPERIVFDVQPACERCALHSGYPIVSNLQFSRRSVSLHLRKSWGFWREQDKMIQVSQLNATSPGEATCNSIGFFVINKLCNMKLEPTSADDQADILYGVSVIQVEEKKGDFLTIYGEKAFPLMVAKGWHAAKYPVGAGGRFGKGRMIGFANRDVLWPANGQDVPPGMTDLDRLLLNMFKWLSGNKTPKLVALVDGHTKMGDFLEANGINSTKVSFDELKLYENLQAFDIMVIVDFVPEDCFPNLQRYLRDGGGIAMSYTQWKLGRGRLKWGTFAQFGEKYPPNTISKNFGFVWRYVPREPYAEENLPDFTYDLSRSYLAGTTLLELWDRIKTIMSNLMSANETEVRNLAQTFILNAHTVPKKEFHKLKDFYSDVQRFVTASQPMPTEAAPVVNQMDKAKLYLFETLTSDVMKLGDVVAHPASDVFPGKVFVPKDFPERMTRLISLNKPDRAWISTGMYAVAGKMLTVSVEEMDAKQASDLILQVGCHPLNIHDEYKWHRIPFLHRQVDITNGTATVNSPYGGSIYVYNKSGTTLGEKPLKFSFDGAVMAPYFKLGETSLEQWQKNRLEPGAWAELVTEKVIFSIPSEDVRNLDDPTPALQEWDKGMNAINDLFGKPHDRPRPERLVADVRFWKYGYPTYFFGKYRKIALDPGKVKSGESWILWQMIARIHQERWMWWNFEESWNVGYKVIIVYVLNTIGGLQPEAMHPGINPSYHRDKVRDYQKKRLDFEFWSQYDWFALSYYLQLQRAYGWNAFKKTHAAYSSLSEDQRPRNNQAKLDMWVIMFSKSVEQNLYDFHKSWGFPISSGVAEQLKHFPTTNMTMTDLLK